MDNKPGSVGWVDIAVASLLLLILSLSTGRILYRESLLKKDDTKTEFREVEDTKSSETSHL